MSERPSDGFGKRLARYRRLNGLSARELAEMTGFGLTRGVIANIESGRKTDVTIDQLVSLSWALQVPMVALALPLQEPMKFVRVLESDLTQQVLRAHELLAWALWRLDNMDVDNAPMGNPAAYVASATVEQLLLRQALVKRVRALRQEVEQGGNVQDDLERAAAQLAECERQLGRLEVDLKAFRSDE